MDIIGIIASAIRSKKKEVIAFILRNGGSVNASDSDVRIGDELSKVLSSSSKARVEFSALLSGANISNAPGDAPVTVATTTTPAAEEDNSWSTWFSSISGSSSTDSETSTDKSAANASMLSSITGLFGTVITAAGDSGGTSGSDQLRMQLINANIARDSAATTTTTLAIVGLVVIMLIVGFLIFKKYQ